jgi:hypothetical protein
MSEYGSTTEVKAFTRYLLGGETGFNSTTTPTGTELTKFLDRASAALNLSLQKYGFSSPITAAMNSTAKLVCDDWVVDKAAQFVELTQPGVGFSGEEGGRMAGFAALQKEADEFVKMNELGFKRIGVTVAHKKSEGLAFTGLDAPSERSDPDDTTIVQPAFKRNLFDDSRTVNGT